MKTPLKELRELIDYSYHDEEKHYIEEGRPKRHVFRSIRTIDNWLTKLEEPVIDIT